MTLYHQKPSKPGRRTSSKPKKSHPWKMGISRKMVEIPEYKLPNPNRKLAG